MSKSSSCANGDVKLTDDSQPYIYWNNKWSPICGHYFWDNNIGADKFCRKIGHQTGVIFDKQGYHYPADALRVGKCREEDVWDEGCTDGQNGYEIGGKIGLTGACCKNSNNAFKIRCHGRKIGAASSSCNGTCK